MSRMMLSARVLIENLNCFSLTAMSVASVIATAVIVGASNVGTEVTFDELHIMTGGRSIRGIVEGDSHYNVFIPTLIDLFAQGRFPFDKLITFYPFERINDAIRDSETGTAIKPVLRFP
jgi:aryl-alcohol dehydrogenase